MPPPQQSHNVIERTVREEWGRCVAALTAYLGDLALAEDALQDAALKAIDVWAQQGLPASPKAWLMTAAKRRAIDHIRRDKTLQAKAADIAYLTGLDATSETHDSTPLSGEMGDIFPDKRLELIFTCCHPALSEKTRVALTLKTIGGLTTEEIAAAYLDKPATMAARLTRAKAKIRLAGIPYKVPDASILKERLSGVLKVIYLIFNEGYAATSGDRLTRAALIDEAIRLGRIMAGLMPDEAEVRGLLALMILHDARRHARTDKDGNMIALEHQNRARWDKAKIKEGSGILKAALGGRSPERGSCENGDQYIGHRRSGTNRINIGPYQLQASISAVHLEAADWASTDWPQIAALYGLLYRVSPTPVVRINEALAVSYASSPEEGLKVLAEIAETHDMTRYQPYHAAKADLLTRSGDLAGGRDALKQAIELSDNAVEKAFLKKKLAALRDHQ